jgi:predicted heme/steroid binding protein
MDLNTIALVNKHYKLIVSLFVWCLVSILLTGCQTNNAPSVNADEESSQAKALLQGIWLDDNDEVAFRAKGDTIFYPDSTSLPAYFKVVGDTFLLGQNKYPIIKQSSHLFWFRNQMGDVVKLKKSDDPNDVLDFVPKHPKVMNTLTEVFKIDSVVIFNGERYHWYIAINPTKYKVSKSSYNDDGVGVENVYYDNIIHISVFNGAKRLFSSDFNKKMYQNHVPEQFLSQSILGNMQFDHVDASGFHFNATICIPDGASCYMVSTDIGLDGAMSMKLLEY